MAKYMNFGRCVHCSIFNVTESYNGGKMAFGVDKGKKKNCMHTGANETIKFD